MDELKTTETAKPKVVLIDDLSLRREGLAQLLRPWARSSRVALAYDDSVSGAPGIPDGCQMVVVNIGGDSIDNAGLSAVVEAAAKASPPCPVVVVCDHVDNEEVISAFKMGVRGFVPASMEPAVALQTFSFLLGGGSYFPPTALLERARGTDSANDGGGDDDPGGNGNNGQRFGLRGLTPKQSEVLDRLRLGKSNKVIGRELGMQEATVKVHVRQIMRKLGASNRTEAALLAVQAEAEAVTEEAAHEDRRGCLDLASAELEDADDMEVEVELDEASVAEAMDMESPRLPASAAFVQADGRRPPLVPHRPPPSVSSLSLAHEAYTRKRLWVQSQGN